MMKAFFGLIIALLVTTTAQCYAQDAAYYKAIQKNSAPQIDPAQFRKLEETALKEFDRAESYEILARFFGGTTEKIWAVVYGEVYCDLSAQPDHINHMGLLIYEWYDRSLSKAGKSLSIDLTENAQTSGSQAPFEAQFEQIFLMSAFSLGDDVTPMSIRTLTEIRKKQLALWHDKKMRQTELTRRQDAISSAGHFEAYNYWLFRAARQVEFNEWLKSHESQFQAWLDWQSENKFQVHTPDFQRLYLLRK